MTRRVVLLGATGSVGTSALKAIEGGDFRLVGLAGGRDAAGLAAIAERFRPDMTVVADPLAGADLAARLGPLGLASDAGEGAVAALAAMAADRVVVAIPGFAALRPTLAAVDAGRTICLANKECLVAAGDVVLARAARAGATILPVDSEHNAVFQVFEAAHRAAIVRIVLTASGGPFRTWSAADMARVRPADALKHPNWSMGAKITIDSATMMNKGLEVIEAARLFDLPSDMIGVVVHKESIVHGMVEYADGSVLAHLSNPSMVTPVAHSLHWPERGPAPVTPLDLAARGTLSFEPPDEIRFPALALARQALAAGGVATNILNAANEVAVAAFLNGRIGFLDIARTVDATLARASALPLSVGSIEGVEDTDRTARRIATDVLAPAG